MGDCHSQPAQKRNRDCVIKVCISLYPQYQHTDSPNWSLYISITIRWENLVKDQSIFPQVIILWILTTFSVDCVLILLGENWCWSLLGFKGICRCKVTSSLRKQLTFRNARTGFPEKWHLRIKWLQKLHIDDVHYTDLGNTSDWSCQAGNLILPIRSTMQIWVVTRHQNGISALDPQTSFRVESNGSAAKCRLFS